MKEHTSGLRPMVLKKPGQIPFEELFAGIFHSFLQTEYGSVKKTNSTISSTISAQFLVEDTSGCLVLKDVSSYLTVTYQDGEISSLTILPLLSIS